MKTWSKTTLSLSTRYCPVCFVPSGFTFSFSNTGLFSDICGALRGTTICPAALRVSSRPADENEASHNSDFTMFSPCWVKSGKKLVNYLRSVKHGDSGNSVFAGLNSCCSCRRWKRLFRTLKHRISLVQWITLRLNPNSVRGLANESNFFQTLIDGAHQLSTVKLSNCQTVKLLKLLNCLHRLNRSGIFLIKSATENNEITSMPYFSFWVTWFLCKVQSKRSKELKGEWSW